jgi:hypothetical protein
MPFVKHALAFVVVSFLLTSAGLCQTSRERQALACQDDALRLCGPYIPDEVKIRDCLVARKASLSPACRAEISPAKQKKGRKSSS